MGFFINSTTGKPTFANSVAASTTFGTDYNTGSNDGIGFVNDNPNQEYVGKADAAVTQSMYGSAGCQHNGALQQVMLKTVNQLLH